jgi:hypothetical protein
MDLGQQNGTEIFLGYRILLVEKWCGPKSMVVRAIVLGEVTKSLLVFGPKLRVQNALTSQRTREVVSYSYNVAIPLQNRVISPYPCLWLCIAFQRRSPTRLRICENAGLPYIPVTRLQQWPGVANSKLESSSTVPFLPRK